MKTDYKKLIQQAKEIDEKATPGPWMWDMNENNQQCLLTTTHSGKYYVMGFQRYGMQSALPSITINLGRKAEQPVRLSFHLVPKLQ